MPKQKPKPALSKKRRAPAGKQPASKSRGKPESVDYIVQGVGKYVRMHVKQLNGYYDAMALSDLLNKAMDVWYDSTTSFVEFRWPTLETTKLKPSVRQAASDNVNRFLNNAVNQFMQRCDRIEFSDTQQVESGVTIQAQVRQAVAPGVTVIRAV